MSFSIEKKAIFLTELQSADGLAALFQKFGAKTSEKKERALAKMMSLIQENASLFVNDQKLRINVSALVITFATNPETFKTHFLTLKKLLPIDSLTDSFARLWLKNIVIALTEDPMSSYLASLVPNLIEQLGPNCNILLTEELTLFQYVLQHSDLSRIIPLLSEQGIPIHAIDPKSGKNALHIVIEAQELEGVPFCIHQGCDINAKTKEGFTPLMLACLSYQLDIVYLLLENGADPEIPDPKGRTALHFAAAFKDLKMIQLCLQNKADVNRQDDKEITPILYATDPWEDKIADMDCIRTLFQAGANIHFITSKEVNLFSLALSHGLVPVVQFCIEHKISLSPLCAATAFLLASQKNQSEVFLVYLEAYGLKQFLNDLPNKLRIDPLFFIQLYCSAALCKASYGTACFKILSEITEPFTISAQIKELINNKPDKRILIFTLLARAFDIKELLKFLPNHTHQAYTDLLSALAHDENQEAIDALIALNIPNVNIDTALSIAVNTGKEKLVHHLLQKKANVEIKDKDGFTPLQSACLSGDLSIAQLLIEHKANIAIQSDEKETLLHFALQNDRIQDSLNMLLFLLQQSSWDVNGADNKGTTPLHLAMYHGNIGAVRELIKRKADLSAQSEGSLTPLHWGVAEGCKAMRKNPDQAKEILDRYLECVDELIKNQADLLLKQDDLLQMPLHIACLYEGVDFVYELSARYWEALKVPNKSGFRPLDILCKKLDMFKLCYVLGELLKLSVTHKENPLNFISLASFVEGLRKSWIEELRNPLESCCTTWIRLCPSESFKKNLELTQLILLENYSSSSQRAEEIHNKIQIQLHHPQEKIDFLRLCCENPIVMTYLLDENTYLEEIATISKELPSTEQINFLPLLSPLNIQKVILSLNKKQKKDLLTEQIESERSSVSEVLVSSSTTYFEPSKTNRETYMPVIQSLLKKIPLQCLAVAATEKELKGILLDYLEGDLLSETQLKVIIPFLTCEEFIKATQPLSFSSQISCLRGALSSQKIAFLKENNGLISLSFLNTVSGQLVIHKFLKQAIQALAFISRPNSSLDFNTKLEALLTDKKSDFKPLIEFLKQMDDIDEKIVDLLETYIPLTLKQLELPSSSLIQNTDETSTVKETNLDPYTYEPITDPFTYEVEGEEGGLVTVQRKSFARWLENHKDSKVDPYGRRFKDGITPILPLEPEKKI